MEANCPWNRDVGMSKAEAKAKYMRAYYLAHRDGAIAASKDRYAAKREEICLARAKRRESHRAEAAAATQAWRDNHPGRDAGNSRSYRSRNLGKVNALVARRAASQIRATPAWANQFFIEEIYDLAQLRTRYLGVVHHVDHIVPLRSPLDCGLHVENNLRVIPAVMNISKGNRHWPYMPA